MVNNLKKFSNYFISNNYNSISQILKENNIIGFLVIEISNSSKIKEVYGKDFYEDFFNLAIEFVFSLKGKIYRSEDLVFINDFKDNQVVLLLISKPRKKEELDMYNIKLAAIRIISEIKSKLLLIDKYKEIIKDVVDALSYGYCIIKYEESKDIKDIIFDAFREAYIRQKFDEINENIISMISHELRTPLTSIKGFAETIIYENLDKQEILKFVNIIYLEADRLNRLVNAILELSRLESAKIAFNTKKIDLKYSVENAIELLYPKIKNNNLKLIRNYSQKEEYEAIADEDKTEQIVINLLDNAIKYSLNSKEITIGIENKDSEVLVYIKDQGIGIPENEKNKIFEKFYRTSITKNITQGTGLGLVITKYLVEGQGGKIWFESKENVGDSFYFTLPKHT